MYLDRLLSSGRVERISDILCASAEVDNKSQDMAGVLKIMLEELGRTEDTYYVAQRADTENAVISEGMFRLVPPAEKPPEAQNSCYQRI